MSISPWKKTATRPVWTVTVKKADNTALDISSATFAGKLHRRETNSTKATAGSYAISDATSGIFTYAPTAGDVDTAGTFDWQTTLTISGATYIVTEEVVIEETY